MILTEEGKRNIIKGLWFIVNFPYEIEDRKKTLDRDLRWHKGGLLDHMEEILRG